VREALKTDADLARKVDSELLNLTSTRRRRFEAQIRAALVLEAMDYYEAHMWVSEGPQDRYTCAETPTGR